MRGIGQKIAREILFPNGLGVANFAAKPKMTSKTRQCKSGIPCGGSCISPRKICRQKLGESITSTYADHVKKLGLSNKLDEMDAKMVDRLGQFEASLGLTGIKVAPISKALEKAYLDNGLPVVNFERYLLYRFGRFETGGDVVTATSGMRHLSKRHIGRWKSHLERTQERESWVKKEGLAEYKQLKEMGVLATETRNSVLFEMERQLNNEYFKDGSPDRWEAVKRLYEKKKAMWGGYSSTPVITAANYSQREEY